MTPSVYFYPENSTTPISTLQPKNLGWLLRNISCVEIVTLEYVEGYPSLVVEGRRGEKVFKGIFPFADFRVLRDWAGARRHFRYIGVKDCL